jgi:hypothetical protein
MTAETLHTRRKMSSGKMPGHLGFVPLNDGAPIVMAQELCLNCGKPVDKGDRLCRGGKEVRKRQ